MFHQGITSCYVASTSKLLLVQVRHTRNVLLVLPSVFWQKFSTLFSFAL